MVPSRGGQNTNTANWLGELNWTETGKTLRHVREDLVQQAQVIVARESSSDGKDHSVIDFRSKSKSHNEKWF
mgnify:CR=1 FL=1